MSEFIWLRPWWWLAVIPVLIVFALRCIKNIQKSSWERVCDAHLLKHISHKTQTSYTLRQQALLFGCWLLAIIAMAGPSWQDSQQNWLKSNTSIVIALDASYSMLAEDVSPSRLQRAKHKIADFVSGYQEGQVALVAFAGDAYVVTPFTTDTNTLMNQLSVVEPSIMPMPGSYLSSAINRAGALFKQSGIPRGHLWLITDAELDEDARVSAKALIREGITLSVFALGTREGAPITNEKGELLKNGLGEIVVAKLDRDFLQSLAKIGGGLYRELSLDNQDVGDFIRFFSTLTPSQTQVYQRHSQLTWHDYGYGLLLILLPLYLLVIRHPWLVSLFLVLIWPTPSDASLLDTLHYTKEQRAQLAYNRGSYKSAAMLFDSPEHKGAAYYKAGDYKKALEFFKSNPSTENLYNLGNTYVQLNQLSQALDVYNQVLSIAPEHSDALYNKALVEEALKKIESNPQDKNDSNSKSDPSKNTSGQPITDKPEQSNKEISEDKKTTKITDALSNPKPSDQSQETQSSNDQMATEDESERARQAWISRVPDDPGGLLRRKLLIKHQQRLQEGAHQEVTQTW